MTPASIPITVTPSNVAWLETCHKRFDTLAIHKAFPKVKDVQPVLRFGNVVHACLAALYNPKTPGPLPHAGDLENILHFAFLREGYDSAQERLFDMARAETLLLSYLRQADITDAEATLSVEMGGSWPVVVAGETLYLLSARLDRVLQLPGNLIVGIDYKVSGSTNLPATSAVLCNLVSLKALHPQGGAFEFWVENLTDEGAKRKVFKSSEFKGAVKGLTASVRSYLEAESYEATPNSGCVWCPLRHTCPAINQAAINEEDLEF